MWHSLRSFVARGWSGLQTLSKHVWYHIVDELRYTWRSAIFVVAVVTIAHHQVGLFNAVDWYAFLFFGNLVTVPLPTSSPEVFVMSIDQEVYESDYSARSPLNRCQLCYDLEKLYEVRPKLLVIDLDLSPALWLMRPDSTDPKQAQCQRDLYSLIKKYGAKTVLMSPFSVLDHDVAKTKKRWQYDMQLEGVRFGSAELPVEYGVVIQSHVHARSIVGAAREAIEGKHEEDEIHSVHSDALKRIDPRKYRAGLLSESLRKFNAAGRLYELGDKVVFFGAAWSEEGDTYLTPVGEVHGVEVHAAAFLSLPGLREDTGKDGIRNALAKTFGSLMLSFINALAFLFDFMLALSFGFVISFCWGRYFRNRFGREAHDGQAALYVLGLIAAFVLLILLVPWISLWLLFSFGVWLSPIPIAVGMFIDSFVSGSVAQAVRESSHITRPDATVREGEHHRKVALWLILRRFVWFMVVAIGMVSSLFWH